MANAIYKHLEAADETALQDKLQDKEIGFVRSATEGNIQLNDNTTFLKLALRERDNTFNSLTIATGETITMNGPGGQTTFDNTNDDLTIHADNGDVNVRAGSGVVRLQLSSTNFITVAPQEINFIVPDAFSNVITTVNSAEIHRTDAAGFDMAIGKKVNLAASSTLAASLNLPSGSAPSVPLNGDVWSDGSDVFVRLGGVTYTLDKT